MEIQKELIRALGNKNLWSLKNVVDRINVD